MSNIDQKLPSPSHGHAHRPFFTRVSQQVSRYAGKPVTFVGAILVIIIWGATGPLFDFNDTWQLIINTSTTIITFLMVFLIQNSQNRDTAALQIKLDELIARTEGPRNALLDLEDLDEDMLDRLRADYARMADVARGEIGEGSAGLAPERTIGEVCTPVETVEQASIVRTVADAAVKAVTAAKPARKRATAKADAELDGPKSSPAEMDVTQTDAGKVEETQPTPVAALAPAARKRKIAPAARAVLPEQGGMTKTG